MIDSAIFLECQKSRSARQYDLSLYVRRIRGLLYDLYLSIKRCYKYTDTLINPEKNLVEKNKLYFSSLLYFEELYFLFLW